jgi:beta-galactosidase
VTTSASILMFVPPDNRPKAENSPKPNRNAVKPLNLLIVLVALIAGHAFAGSGVTDTPRQIVSLDSDWRFHLGDISNAIAPDYDDRDWRQVDVPHDYVIEGAFQPTNQSVQPSDRTSWYWLHGFLPTQPATYRKEIFIPAAANGRRLWLEFDGVFSNSRYWLNGLEIGSQYSGYSSSRFDITAAANIGSENLLTVRIDPRWDGWWYEGGGIYRHVRLVMLDPVHVVPNGIFVAPALTDVGNGTNADALVALDTDVTNESTVTGTATLISEILNAEGDIVESGESLQRLSAGEGATLKQQFSLTNASLWTLENPYLYRLRTSIKVAGNLVDQVTTTFGVREVRFNAGRGFFLNGRHIKIQGVNGHQDHAGVGVAMPDRLIQWRLERLKEMGCNAIRLSHNPVEPVMLNDCDRMGILVIAENRHLGDTYADQTPKNTPAMENRDLTGLVMRDRNHPCIILWSLCNEQWTQGSPEGAAMVRAMKKRVNELDPTRLVTAAMNGGFTDKNGFISVLDVIGFNYQPWVYTPFHHEFPDKQMIATEISSEIGTRGNYDLNHWDDYWGDRDRGYVAAYSINAGPGGQTVEAAWPPIATNDFMAGAFVWTGFDYKGEPRPFAWPIINSHYGFMDICGFPKDSYYYYEAWWTEKPVLHVFPHWNWPGREGQDISVWVHSNCQEVELFLNGVSQGKKTVTPYHHLEWKVKYAPGRLVAKGLRSGQPVVAIVETTGAPAAIRLTADRTALAADNCDLAVVNVAILDPQGRIVPTANNKITFTLTGPAKLIGVGNGDPASHEPDKGRSRSAFNGLAQAIVQTTTNGGPIDLKAEAAGLMPASLTLLSK